MKNRITYIKNILLPCAVFSAVTGVVTGALIFLFKLASSAVFDLSARFYGEVREDPRLLPCLIGGAAILGLASSFILHRSKNCRGGGIPTSVALLRGLIDFHWLKSIFLLFASAMITFLGGVPLGNEGPSVQMGTAVGRGTSRIFAKKHRAWDRYIMTGGACSGFAVATGAPLTGIFFAFEEAHRRFSPMLFMVASMTVLWGTASMRVLCRISGLSPSMFDIKLSIALPLKYIWIAIIIGIVCGLAAVLFTKLYSRAIRFINITLKRLPFTLKVILTFVLVSLAGFASSALIGSGHNVIEDLLEGRGTWYFIILCFSVRTLFLMVASGVGVSGGIFVPTLTFGALIGAIFSKCAIWLGILPEEYFVIPIVIAMVSFLSASSRTPITALTFAVEALAGLSNILPIAAGVTFSYLVIETWGVPSLHEDLMASKVAAFNKGKEATIVNTFITVMPDSFAVGKDIRDILWPPTCTVLSVQKPPHSDSTHESLGTGDVLHIHYMTHDPESTFTSLEDIVGPQEASERTKTHMGDESHIVPEL